MRGQQTDLRNEVLQVLYAARANLCSRICVSLSMCTFPMVLQLHQLTSGKRVVVVVEELLRVERLETLQHSVTDSASTKGADNLTLEVESVACDVRYLPVTALDHLVCGHKVADEQEHAHDDVLGDRSHVRAGDLEDLDTFLDGSIEIDVVGTDTSGDAKLQVLGL